MSCLCTVINGAGVPRLSLNLSNRLVALLMTLLHCCACCRPCLHAASQPELAIAAPADLSDMVWALARLRFTPSDAWLAALTAAITGAIQGFSPQGLAAVIWGYTRLGLKPDRLWLLRFRALAAGSNDPGADAQQLAQFVAAFLAQQNRLKFQSSGLVPAGTRARSSSRGASGAVSPVKRAALQRDAGGRYG